MKVKPVLGDWEVPHIEVIKTMERRSFAELAVPGRTGSLFQDLNTEPARIVISGSLFGDENRDAFLEELRGKFSVGEPVTFVADIVTATSVQYVIIETLRMEESGLKPDQIDYHIVLRESPPPPPPSDPFGSLDAGLLDQAGSFLDSVTGALDALDALASAVGGGIPDFSDPSPPLRGALDGVKSAMSGLGDVAGSISELFGE